MNRDFNTTPLVVHTPGIFSKPLIDGIKNFISDTWNPTQGCVACLENVIDLSQTQVINSIQNVNILNNFLPLQASRLSDRFLSNIC